MRTKKYNDGYLLHQLKFNEISTFLKLQIPASLIFINNSNDEHEIIIKLFDRQIIGNKKMIEIEIDEISDLLEYDELFEKINEIVSEGYLTCVYIESKIFSLKEPLIAMVPNINISVINSCVYIDYNNNTFEIINKPFPNKDSDKMYYFELNDTILGFSENGPKLITDNPGINSIEDVIGN